METRGLDFELLWWAHLFHAVHYLSDTINYALSALAHATALRATTQAS